MICPSCHTENIEGADECANCGQALSGLDLPSAGNKYSTAPFMDESLDKLPERAVATVSASDPVALAVRRMQTGDTGAVLVMDGERLVGVITGTDILLKIAGPREDLNAITCGQIMSADPVVFTYADSIALAVNKMSIGEFRHVPIVQDGRPVNIIDVSDLFRHITPHLV